MATTHNTPNYVQTDTRLSWPNWYSWIAGMVIWALGVFAWKGMSILPIVMLAVAVLVLWVLGRIGASGNIRLLNGLASANDWLTTIAVLLVGLVGIFLGSLTGTVLVDFFRAFGVIGVILIFAISVMATAGLLLAVSYRSGLFRVVGIACLLIVAMFLPQFGAGVTQTPVEQTRQVCEQHSDLFKAECP